MSITKEKIVELVEKAKNKDNTAIEKLYDEFYDDVYYICYKILGNQEDAKDITQDTFLEAFISIDNLNDPASFKYWINKIATNKTFNFLKRTKKMSVQSPDEVNQLLDIEDVQIRPEDTVIDTDVKDTLESIIDKLPKEQRTTLFLFYYQEMSIKEIAELYQCSESTVKSRLSYARKFMRKEVENLEDKGYKLRCLTSLPFIFALFNAEKANIPAVEHGNIINALNGYSSSLTNIGSGTGSVVAKISSLSTSTKIIMAVAGAAVIASGVTIATVIANNNNQDIITDPDGIVSSIIDSDISTTESYVSDDISESSVQKEKSYIEWQFKDIAQPKFGNSEYTTIKPLENIQNISDSTRQKEVITATLAYNIDFTEISDKLRKNALLANEYKFAEGEKEKREFQDYSDIGNQVKYTYSQMLYGYTNKADKYKDYNYGFEFTTNQTFSRYNTPQEYILCIKSDKFSQDDIYNITKDIFGDSIAEYLVYADSKSTDITRDTLETTIQTPDNNGKYLLSRTVEREDENSIYEITFSVSYEDSNVSGAKSSYNGGFDYSVNGYNPMVMPIQLSDMLKTDVGSTDLKDEDNFFSKAINFVGEYNTFIKTKFASFDSATVYYLTYDDGTTYNNYYIKGSQALDDVAYIAMSQFIIDIEAIQKPDKSTVIEDFELNFPTAMIYSEGQDDFDKEKECENLLSLSRKQASYILDIDEKAFTSSVKGTPYDIFREIELFGQKVPSIISFDVRGTALGTHNSSIKITKNDSF